MKREVAAIFGQKSGKMQVISVEYVRLNRAKRTSNGASCVYYVPDPCRLCWPIESGFIQETLETPGRVFARLNEKSIQEASKSGKQ
jgi:hypothetical protein